MAVGVSNQPPDVEHLEPMLHRITEMAGALPDQGRLKVISSRARCHASQCEHSPDVVAQFLLARVN